MTFNGTLPMFPDSEKKLLMLMDGHALVHRAWHAIQQPLNISSTGEEVRAVFGFLNTFLKAIADWKPTHCAITFDLSAPTFRHIQYDQYKAHRPKTPDELRNQFTRVRQLVEAFGIPIYEMEGFEADDMLGTLCRHAEEQKIETLVLTGDTDILQLVSPWVRVLLSYGAQNQKVYDEAAVKERYGGLGPESVPDIKALLGDTSDNIPGVPGIGPKNAYRLLNEFGSLEGIYEHVNDVTPARFQKALSENKELAYQGKGLITIHREAPIKLDLKGAEFRTYDRSRVVEFLRELEFFSAVNRIPTPPGQEESAQGQLAFDDARQDKLETKYVVVDTEEKLGKLVETLKTSGGFSFDTETTSQHAMLAKLVGFSFSTEAGNGWYVPVGHEEGQQVSMDTAIEYLKPILEDASIPKAAHNANYDMTVLENYGIVVRGLDFDTMLAAHVSGRKSIGLKALALDLLNEEMTPITELIGTGRKQTTMDKVEIDKAAPYAAADADFTQRLWAIFEKELEEKRTRDAFEDIEVPLVPVLVKMQRNGIALDIDMLKTMAVELGEQLSGLEAGMYELIGHQFNINSSQQLGDVLFKELRLPPTKRTQKGYSTDAASLDTLKQILDDGKAEDVDPKAYEVLDNILEYRQLSKIKSTYVDSLPTLINSETNRIHTSYNQTGSATGRVSSNDPNVQNIPVRTELGRRVRKAFIAGEADWSLLGADYSQIELRILAHMSEDEGLLTAFRNGEDIHSATASSVYDVPITDVTSDMRRVAKIMNFGVLYGLSPHGITQQTGLKRDEGVKFIETYFGKYPGIKNYIEDIKGKVRDLGYVETLNGRRRYIYEIKSSNWNVRASGERMAINMPIQGTAADIIKIAMIRIQQRMDELNMRSKMIIQVHDELIFEVPEDEAEQMRAIIMELMPSAMTLAVPLEVELKAGATWGDME